MDVHIHFRAKAGRKLCFQKQLGLYDKGRTFVRPLSYNPVGVNISLQLLTEAVYLLAM